jgi:hypothetical protein
VVLDYRPRRKILDVWANDEEADIVKEIEDEGDAELADPSWSASKYGAQNSLRCDTTSVQAASTSSWYYRDTSNQLQGPYETAQMLQWIGAGFFPSSTPVQPASASPSDPAPSWSTMDKQPPFCSAFASDSIRRGSVDEESDRASVQARIAVLENHTLHEPDSLEAADDASDSSVQARIAALTAHRPLHEPGRESGKVGSPTDQDGDRDDSVQTRIAALRAPHPLNLEHSSRPNEANQQQHMRPSIQERIQELRHEHLARTQELSAPPPPPPRPVARNANFADSFEGTLEDLSYPIDTCIVDHAEYPVYDSYPSVEAYSVDDTGDDDSMVPATGAYPVTDSYPVDEDSNGYADGDAHATSFFHRDPDDQQPKKRHYHADKEVVSLLPSHLQKRSRRTQGDSAPAGSSTTCEKKGTHGDELEKLFEEVNS